MLSLLAPILAQLVTVSAGERTEGRVVVIGDTHYEAMVRPLLGLTLSDRRLQLQLAYSPAFTLTPIESNPSWLVFHNGVFSANYTYHQTIFTASQYVGFGEQNFRVLATGGAVNNLGGAPSVGSPSSTGGTGSVPSGTVVGSLPTMGNPSVSGTSVSNVSAANTARFFDQNVFYQNFVTNLSVTQPLTHSISLLGALIYSLSGAIETGVRYLYPLLEGPTVNVSVRDQYDRRNIVTSVFSVNYTTATFGNRPPIQPSADALLMTATENWIHQFDSATSAQLGAGLSGGRNSRADGYVAYNVYPALLANLTHIVRLTPSIVTMTIGSSSTPALDPVTLVLDPRVSVLASVAWQRERFFSGIGGVSTFSVSGQRQESFSSVGGAANVGYQFGAAVALDGGVRAAWQNYQGTTVLPFSYAGFVGLTVGVNKLLR